MWRPQSVLAIFAGMIALLGLAGGGAPVQAAGPLADPPIGGPVLMCPDRVHFYVPDIKAFFVHAFPGGASYTLKRWLLERTTPAPVQKKDLAVGFGNVLSYYDLDVEAGDVYTYSLHNNWAKPEGGEYKEVWLWTNREVLTHCVGDVWEERNHWGSMGGMERSGLWNPPRRRIW